MKRTLIRHPKFRIMYCQGWRNKPRPYWFRANYPGNGSTIQIMGLELWIS